MESKQVSENVKKELKKIYDSLNPAQLKRDIDVKINKLCKVYEEKNNSQKVASDKKLKPVLVRWLNDLTWLFGRDKTNLICR